MSRLRTDLGAGCCTHSTCRCGCLSSCACRLLNDSLACPSSAWLQVLTDYFSDGAGGPKQYLQ